MMTWLRFSTFTAFFTISRIVLSTISRNVLSTISRIVLSTFLDIASPLDHFDFRELRFSLSALSLQSPPAYPADHGIPSPNDSLGKGDLRRSLRDLKTFHKLLLRTRLGIDETWIVHIGVQQVLHRRTNRPRVAEHLHLIIVDIILDDLRSSHRQSQRRQMEQRSYDIHFPHTPRKSR